MKVYCSQGNCSAYLEFSNTTAAIYTCKNHVIKASDGVRFQDYQFDPSMRQGTNPKTYEQGATPSITRQAQGTTPSITRHAQSRLIHKFDTVLANHENAVEILEVLNADVRDSNSGVNNSSDGNE